MYKVISANRSPQRAPKNWRVYERESMEKYFGPVIDVNGEDGHSVLDAYEKYKDSIEFIRWYPDPELLTKQEYDGMVSQNNVIGKLPYITNSVEGFRFVQNKEETFQRWKENNIHCPDFFTFDDSKDFYAQQDIHKIEYPFLLRLNNSVAGKHTYLIKNESNLASSLEQLDKDFISYTSTNSRIGTKKMCVKLINCVDTNRKVNSSFRIHVAGDKVISGYGRVVDQDDWLAITAGKFNSKHIDNFIYYNRFCEKIMTECSDELVRAVQVLDLNHQGVDVIYDFDKETICFLEVQPTYASGYPQVGWCGYVPPFYNPSDPTLVNFLLENKKELSPLLPKYYNNWLDKENHFDLVYKTLKDYINVRS